MIGFDSKFERDVIIHYLGKFNAQFVESEFPTLDIYMQLGDDGVKPGIIEFSRKTPPYLAVNLVSDNDSIYIVLYKLEYVDTFDPCLKLFNYYCHKLIRSKIEDPYGHKLIEYAISKAMIAGY